MLHFSRMKVIGVIVVCLMGLLFTLPNLFPRETVQAWPSFVPKRQIPLGNAAPCKRTAAAHRQIRRLGVFHRSGVHGLKPSARGLHRRFESAYGWP